MRIIRGEPDVTASLDRFYARLAETVAWCAPRADVRRPRDCLRTPRLEPRRLESDYFAAVSTVVHQRASAVRREACGEGGSGKGRLMVYYPDADLSCGAAEVESEGFFDVCNVPPWDTWVGMFRDDVGNSTSAHYVVAWVPPALVELAGRGMEVNPESCIAWLDDVECGLRRALGGGVGWGRFFALRRGWR